LTNFQRGPKGGTIFDAPITLYVSGRGWVTSWSEVHEPPGGIVKRGYERPATDDEIFIAQMLTKEGLSHD
jgi:hypothetical protein